MSGLGEGTWRRRNRRPSDQARDETHQPYQSRDRLMDGRISQDINVHASNTINAVRDYEDAIKAFSRARRAYPESSRAASFPFGLLGWLWNLLKRLLWLMLGLLAVSLALVVFFRLEPVEETSSRVGAVVRSPNATQSILGDFLNARPGTALSRCESLDECTTIAKLGADQTYSDSATMVRDFAELLRTFISLDKNDLFARSGKGGKGDKGEKPQPATDLQEDANLIQKLADDAVVAWEKVEETCKRKESRTIARLRSQAIRSHTFAKSTLQLAPFLGYRVVLRGLDWSFEIPTQLEMQFPILWLTGSRRHRFEQQLGAFLAAIVRDQREQVVDAKACAEAIEAARALYVLEPLDDSTGPGASPDPNITATQRRRGLIDRLLSNADATSDALHDSFRAKPLLSRFIGSLVSLPIPGVPPTILPANWDRVVMNITEFNKLFPLLCRACQDPEHRKQCELRHQLLGVRGLLVQLPELEASMARDKSAEEAKLGSLEMKRAALNKMVRSGSVGDSDRGGKEATSAKPGPASHVIDEEYVDSLRGIYHEGRRDVALPP